MLMAMVMMTATTTMMMMVMRGWTTQGADRVPTECRQCADGVPTVCWQCSSPFIQPPSNSSIPKHPPLCYLITKLSRFPPLCPRPQIPLQQYRTTSTS